MPLEPTASLSDHSSSGMTVFVCPACAYWHGASDGLSSKPGRCPRCVSAYVDGHAPGLRNITTRRDLERAPMMEPLAVAPRFGKAEA